MGLKVIHYAKTVKRKGILAVNARKIKALTVKMDIRDIAGGQSDTGKGR
jgi:hypothetical protein